tara:strand:- start:1570 stop:1776 length:207 start_codon:yes stop_codon:yes gene_type:complete
MNDKSDLITKHEHEGLSKQELGQLRRIILTELLDNIMLDVNDIDKWLDKKKTKFDMIFPQFRRHLTCL